MTQAAVTVSVREVMYTKIMRPVRHYAAHPLSKDMIASCLVTYILTDLRHHHILQSYSHRGVIAVACSHVSFRHHAAHP